MTGLARALGLLAILVSCVCAEDYVPKANEFPPIEHAVYLAGELALVDPINRRGAIRLDCKVGDAKRSQHGPLHYFAMLPCGEVWRHAAPANLRDIPIGSHVQGYFFVPPAGHEDVIPPPPEDLAELIPKQNHALLIEDDISFYQRQGQNWKIVSIDPETSKMQVESVGKTAEDGISGALTLDYDLATRVWRAGRPAGVDSIEPGSIVQINFARGNNWRDHEFGVNDIWLDAESREQSAELQRRQNVRYQRKRWIPGRIESVVNHDYGGGLIDIVIYGGVAQQLLDNLEADKDERVAVCAAEPTLRTWTHRSDRVFGKITEFEIVENPPVGFSGVRLHMKFAEILDHFRPGNSVRVKAENWLWISNTPEERIKSLEERERSRTLRLPN